MYLYETHLHTSPVSKCAKATPREQLEFYKSRGYAGVFITNHFIDGNISAEKSTSYEELLNYYFSDYEEGVKIGKEIGIDVFCGVEMSYGGTDFLVYGIDKEWYLSHPEEVKLPKSQLLPLLMENGALVIQAHPFREARYIDHIRLFPRCIQGVEVYNAARSDFENKLAMQYAENYELVKFAGSDNHIAGKMKKFGGMQSEIPIKDETDFVARVLSGEIKPFKDEIIEE